MKFGKLFSSLTVVGLFSAFCAAHADQLADVKAKGSLVCGVVGALEPFAFEDAAKREVVGYDVDFCKAVDKRIGLKAELKVISLDERIPELTLGREDIQAQTRNVIDAIAASLAEHGLGMENVVRANCWLSDIKMMKPFNEVYQTYFPKGLPVRSTLEAKLSQDVDEDVEIEVMAWTTSVNRG